MKHVPAIALFAALLTLAGPGFAQTKTGKAAKTAPAKAAKPAEPVQAESLSGLDLVPNRHTGQFAIRIKHRFTKPATFKLTNTQTGQVLMTELLQPSAQAIRALNAGRLANGTYRMEVLIPNPDTVYWKEVRITR